MQQICIIKNIKGTKNISGLAITYRLVGFNDPYKKDKLSWFAFRVLSKVQRRKAYAC